MSYIDACIERSKDRGMIDGRVSDSPQSTGSLPQWLDVDGKVARGEKLTAMEQFIYDFDIADPEQSDKFRKGLLAVLREENS